MAWCGVTCSVMVVCLVLYLSAYDLFNNVLQGYDANHLVEGIALYTSSEASREYRGRGGRDRESKKEKEKVEIQIQIYLDQRNE